MTPEISHRCPSCGVSIRTQGALFCPECGKPLSAAPVDAQESESSHSEADKSQVTSEPAEATDEPSLAESAPVSAAQSNAGATPQSQTLEGNDQLTRSPDVSTAAEKNEAPAARLEPNAGDDAPGQATPRRGEKTRERLHRASAVARGVIEDEVKRVEKIRHVSSVVIEEASYDPSLRFVLVALALFVIFVILLVLSKVMG
jgi:uncharacterized Zn finger protein (UPF0148 family)